MIALVKSRHLKIVVPLVLPAAAECCAGTQMNRAVMLAGKLLPYYLINLIQLVIMLGAFSLLFGIGLGSSLSGLALRSGDDHRLGSVGLGFGAPRHK